MNKKVISASIITAAMSPLVVGAVQSVSYEYEQVENVRVFYREIGDKSAPTILMLHGFAASSYMWRDVMNALSGDYHLIALDLPAFGYTKVPADNSYQYTFANLTKTVEKFIEQKGLTTFALAVHDYGAPVGWRIATTNPEKITAIISQNGNAYEEGLGAGWKPIKKYWKDPSRENRIALSDFPTPESIKWQYEEGVDDLSKISPDGYTLEGHHITKEGMSDIQLDLLLDYASNVEQYPQYQAYFRKHQPPILAVWGKNDPFFLPDGATAWKKDIPNAEVHFYDTGHFALETHQSEIIPVIKRFLNKTLNK
ncbi:alpha/beta fold hydrolase [Pseudoalteromonas piscicida]|uniref:alpha/beta fold hydrolase n=1 Tax=Pseudoalteromonas piscicida TaxID=43662 RepID=UPI0027E49809|nr:alpha/beta hydrolase [Pseudoalteromonas piscicida]WMO16119.1 alpha/beta hydrolase [Pseudoalteromonas piscicida]